MEAYLGLKISKEIEHAEDFLNGALYMNTLSYFIGLEDKYESCNIGDKYEAPDFFVPNDNFILEIKTDLFHINLTNKDVVGPLVDRSTAAKLLHVFCFTITSSSGLINQLDGSNPDSIDWFENEYKIQEDSPSKIGEYSILIKDVEAFILRIHKKLNSLCDKGLIQSCKTGFVNYYNETEHQNFDGSVISKAFNKRSSFAHQREYRIAVMYKSSLANDFNFDAKFLEIGDIHDIAMLIKTDDVNNLKLYEAYLREKNAR